MSVHGRERGDGLVSSPLPTHADWSDLSPCLAVLSESGRLTTQPPIFSHLFCLSIGNGRGLRDVVVS